jgi:preprotein translocase subunit SecD
MSFGRSEETMFRNLPAAWVIVASATFGLLAPDALQAADKPALPAKRVAVEFRLAENEPGPDLIGMPVGDTDEQIYVTKTAALKNGDVAKADARRSQVDPASYEVSIEFTEAGGKKMEALSEANLGKRLAVLVDGKVLSAPKLQTKISSRAVITGKISADDARRIARGIVQP